MHANQLINHGSAIWLTGIIIVLYNRAEPHKLMLLGFNYYAKAVRMATAVSTIFRLGHHGSVANCQLPDRFTFQSPTCDSDVNVCTQQSTCGKLKPSRLISEECAPTSCHTSDC